MTLMLVLQALLRSWPVVVLGLTLTGIAVLQLIAPAPLYRTVTEVQFSAPAGTPPAGDMSLDLVSFAATVERTHNGGDRASPLSSTTAPLHGTGIREGVSVRLPNSGTQWEASYLVPHLTVEVVAGSEERVLEIHAETVESILTTARRLQFDQGVPERGMAVAREDPAQPEISYVGSSRSGKIRGVGAMAVVGVGATTFAAIAVDRYRSSRRLAQSSSSTPTSRSRLAAPART